MSAWLIKPPPESDASSLLPLVTSAEHEGEEDDEASAALVLLDNGNKVFITVSQPVYYSTSKVPVIRD
jgi:hypothetical protein